MATHALARNLFLSASAGLIAAWMLAMMPVHILYSQAARGYSLSILLAILALYAIHRAVTEGPFRQWISFGLWGSLAPGRCRVVHFTWFHSASGVC